MFSQTVERKLQALTELQLVTHLFIKLQNQSMGGCYENNNRHMLLLHIYKEYQFNMFVCVFLLMESAWKYNL